MRKSTLTSQEVSEMDKMNNRKSGYALMSIKDRGFARLSNSVVVRWNAPTPWSEPSGDKLQTRRSTIPDGTFEINGILFNAEELRKFLRWA